MTPEAQQLDPLLQFFVYDHLPDRLREISAPFGALALTIVTTLPRNSERTVALRKLLEAKDCAVRSRFFREFMGAGMMMAAPNAKPEQMKAQDRPPPGEVDWPRHKFEQAARAKRVELEGKTNTAQPPAPETYTALPPTTTPPTPETDKPDTPTG